MKKTSYVCLSLTLVMVFAAIVGFSSAQAAEDKLMSTESKMVTINDNSFQPSMLTIKKGETVTWINKGSAGHTVTGKNFDSGPLNKDQTFKQVFNESGTFDYWCTPHPEMKGTIMVQ